MWAEAFVPSFIEVLPLISAFLMQFKIKEMKGKAACERLYKQDSRGALKGSFVRGFGRLSPEGRSQRLGSGWPKVWEEQALGTSRLPSNLSPTAVPASPVGKRFPGRAGIGMLG